MLHFIFSLYNIKLLEKIENTKEVIRSRKSKDRQYNAITKRKDKRTNNDLQYTTH